ncbi:MAG TPA: hypothetical protein VE084_04250 [Burkholderiaceae bacterium]|nr:hypothetical protein [Burkholderiaceae bacterium]
MGIADFLLSLEVQELLKTAYARPAEPFTASDVPRAGRADPAAFELALEHLLAQRVLLPGPMPNDDTDGDIGPATYVANTGFLFYPELRRMALKSFAAAEPLRQMLRTRFRRAVRQAWILGENVTAGTVSVLVVHGEQMPDPAELDAALRKLLKSGRMRMHLEVQVLSEAAFRRQRQVEPLRGRLSGDGCIELVAADKTQADAGTAPRGLLARARHRLAALSGRPR